MRCRATMAGMMAILLIAISCAAAACTARCGLPAMSPQCHRAMHSQEHRMAAMEHRASLCSTSDAASPHGTNAPCHEHLCVERSTAAKAELPLAVDLNLMQQA